VFKLSKNILILPPQLYEKTFELKDINKIFLYEHPYYFKKFNYHKQKLILHRASMKSFQNRLSKYYKIIYINYNDSFLDKIDENNLLMYKPSDSYIKKQFKKQLRDINIKLKYIESPKFLTNMKYNQTYFKDNKFYHFNYYKDQRKRLNILVDNGKPLGNKWSYDPKNRKKFPKDINIKSRSINENAYVNKAKNYIEKHFPNNPGETDNFIWPINNKQANKFFDEFLIDYFHNFGPYQDAFDTDIDYGFHSLLSASLNIGIITPSNVIDNIIKNFQDKDVNIESVEGFIRQIIGWREYVKAVYDLKETEMKDSNFFCLKGKMLAAFYTGQTNIKPVDTAIKRVNKNAYTHHIERLMVLGNIMLLLNINPNEVYNWFMEFFIDGYDWVMVPNIYGMSQFSYPKMMTKPYISSSNYILKMSHYKKDDWSEIWDGLYWNFIDENKKSLSDIKKMNLMLSIMKKMDKEKLNSYKRTASNYKKSLLQK